MGHNRRKSVDSSSSSSSSDSDDSHGRKLSKQERKERKERKKAAKSGHHKAGVHGPASGHSQAPLMPMVPGEFRGMPQAPQDHHNQGFSAPPASGYRIPLTTTAQFPAHQQVGTPPCTDADGSPVYFGSALFENSVHPCKIGPHLNPPCLVPYAGNEHGHQGRYDLLPFDPATMELVRTSYGNIPAGRRPIEGGYEDHGAKLYHAVGVIDGYRIPGKTGTHLGGCNVPWGGSERVVSDYEILCWK